MRFLPKRRASAINRPASGQQAADASTSSPRSGEVARRAGGVIRALPMFMTPPSASRPPPHYVGRKVSSPWFDQNLCVTLRVGELGEGALHPLEPDLAGDQRLAVDLPFRQQAKA